MGRGTHEIFLLLNISQTTVISDTELLFDRTAINDYVMELLIMAYACKTSSANRIIGK